MPYSDIGCCEVDKNSSGPGPSPGFNSRGAKKQMEGPKTGRRGHKFQIQYLMYAATEGPNVKWGGIDFKWGVTTGSPAVDGTALAFFSAEKLSSMSCVNKVT